VLWGWGLCNLITRSDFFYFHQEAAAYSVALVWAAAARCSASCSRKLVFRVMPDEKSPPPMPFTWPCFTRLTKCKNSGKLMVPFLSSSAVTNAMSKSLGRGTLARGSSEMICFTCKDYKKHKRDTRQTLEARGNISKRRRQVQHETQQQR